VGAATKSTIIFVPNGRWLRRRRSWPARRKSSTFRIVELANTGMAARATAGKNSNIVALLPQGRAQHAAEADVACRGVHRLALPRGRAVAQTVVGRAQVRAALHHPTRHPRGPALRRG